MCPIDRSNKKISSKLLEEMYDEAGKEKITELAKQVSQLKKHLKIPNELATGIIAQFNQSYEDARSNIALVGGSEDDVAKMWGYNFGGLMYHYLERRDSIEGRQALSFIKMQLGHELNTKLGGSEIQYASFVLGLSLRFIKGFETLKKNLIEFEDALNKFEQHRYTQQNDVKTSGTDLFGRKRK
ncbi:MAG: hypothetical protein JSW11_16160 [Candidatus Heimdallarchaeota archaeon]|nr:MAG: hypothetical protein JSW11_16160 [Candidatus Heimdallarchaeota archaeon]